ncbi:MAG: DMT family transporter [Amphritea sp.]
MKPRDILDLVLLAALWGGSFIFMRVAAPEFGPIAMIELRVALAALFLLPILLLRGGSSEMKTHWKALFIVGALNSAIPFCLFGFATLYLAGGFTSIVNAASPLWGALIAWFWLGDKLNLNRQLGLLIGFAGVIILVWDKVSLEFTGSALAIPAAMVASIFYGVAASYAKRHLMGVSSLSVATGSQLGAALLLLPLTPFVWPQQHISMTAWISVIVMAVACTGIAYILYFRLISNVGPVKAISVTFLVPVFGVIWGSLFIDETLTTSMIIGCGVILLGTAMATGLITTSRRSSPPAKQAVQSTEKPIQ